MKAQLGLDDADPDADAYLDEEAYSDEEGEGYVPSTMAVKSHGKPGSNGASPMKGGGDRVAMLTAANDELESEVRKLRGEVGEEQERTRQEAARAEQSMAIRANALKHLQAAEDHVGLLIAESRSKLEALTREKEQMAPSNAGNVGAASPGAVGRISDEERQELELLRGEVQEWAKTQEEMDAEAEEREGELMKAYAQITHLQQQLAEARGVA